MIATLGGAGLHFASTPMGEMYWLCTGVLIGGFLQMAVPAALGTMTWLGRGPHENYWDRHTGAAEAFKTWKHTPIGARARDPFGSARQK